jgi:hypothetical protein
MKTILPTPNNDLGPMYSRGNSFRARAEKRQCEYRAEQLKVGCAEWGHWLDSAAEKAGLNFIVPEAFEAAKARMSQGKGVASQRTFGNMLSSQAMCFNLFAPLARDEAQKALAAKVLGNFIGNISAIREINIEYTPSNEIFGDQTGRGGVDCDVLIDCLDKGGKPVVVTLETKFVEKEFSTCGFRKVCPADLVLDAACSNCRYSSSKKYRYWNWSQETGNLRPDKLPAKGCAFGGPLWQLWVNHTLACAEGRKRNATRAIFGVCAPAKNEALLKNGILDQFRSYLKDPASFVFIDVDDLIETIRKNVEKRSDWHDRWGRGLTARYAGI